MAKIKTLEVVVIPSGTGYGAPANMYLREMRHLGNKFITKLFVLTNEDALRYDNLLTIDVGDAVKHTMTVIAKDGTILLDSCPLTVLRQTYTTMIKKHEKRFELVNVDWEASYIQLTDDIAAGACIPIMVEY